jgi:hypothetical protein
MSNNNDLNDCAQNLPPRVAGDDDAQQVFSASISGSASSISIWGSYATDDGGQKTPKGKCWLELEALANAAYVRFGSASTTATTTSTGAIIPVGSPRKFYVDPTKDKYIDVIGAGSGTLKWRRLGRIAERSRV